MACNCSTLRRGGALYKLIYELFLLVFGWIWSIFGQNCIFAAFWCFCSFLLKIIDLWPDIASKMHHFGLFLGFFGEIPGFLHKNLILLIFAVFSGFW